MAKGFKDNINSDNPTLSFISTEEIKAAAASDQTQATQEEPAPKYFINPKAVEKKSKRLNLLIRPSIHAGMKEAAEKYNTSVCELINAVLEDFLKGDK